MPYTEKPCHYHVFRKDISSVLARRTYLLEVKYACLLEKGQIASTWCESTMNEDTLSITYIEDYFIKSDHFNVKIRCSGISICNVNEE